MTVVTPHRGRNLVVAVVVFVAATLGIAQAASAHSVLISSTPVNGAVLTAAPHSVVLTFNENIIDLGDVVVVTGPNGANFSSGAAKVVDATVTQQLATLPYNGLYQITYRIVSGDGHPVSRTLSFTLNAAGLPQATAAASPSGSPTDVKGGKGAALPAILTGAFVVILLIAVVAWAVSRRKDRSSIEDEDKAGPSDSAPPTE